jgi:hypothetical protein
MTLLVSLLAALAGLVVYILATNPKAAELGRILFFTGTLATLLAVSHSTVKLLS